MDLARKPLLCKWPQNPTSQKLFRKDGPPKKQKFDRPLRHRWHCPTASKPAQLCVEAALKPNDRRLSWPASVCWLPAFRCTVASAQHKPRNNLFPSYRISDHMSASQCMAQIKRIPNLVSVVTISSSAISVAHMMHGLYLLSGQLVTGNVVSVLSLSYFRCICCRYRFW